MSLNKKIGITLLLLCPVLALIGYVITNIDVQIVFIGSGIISLIMGFFILVAKPLKSKTHPNSNLIQHEGNENKALIIQLPENGTEKYQGFRDSYQGSYRIGKWTKYTLITSIVFEILGLITLIIKYIYGIQGLTPDFTKEGFNFINGLESLHGLNLLISYTSFIIFIILMIIYNHKIIKLMNILGNNLKTSSSWSIVINIILIFRGIIIIPIDSQKAIYTLNQSILQHTQDIDTSKIDTDLSTTYLWIIALITYFGSKIMKGIFPENIYDYITTEQYAQYLKIIPYDVAFAILSIISSIIILRQIALMYDDQKDIIEQGLL